MHYAVQHILQHHILQFISLLCYAMLCLVVQCIGNIILTYAVLLLVHLHGYVLVSWVVL